MRKSSKIRRKLYSWSRKPKKNEVNANIFIVSSVDKDEDKMKSSDCYDCTVMSDSQLRNRLPKELNVDRTDDYTVKHIPQGENMFKFAVLPEKN